MATSASSYVWTSCPACSAARSVGFPHGGQKGACMACNARIEGTVLPAAVKADAPPDLPTDPPAEGDTPCFYSPERKATSSCAQCGVFISEAWSAKWGAKTLCLRCLEKLQKEKRGSQFESHRWLWDNICLLLTILPILLVIFYWALFVTAPAALILGIFAWKKPTSIIPRSRLRLIIALIIATLEIVVILVGVYAVISAIAEFF